MAERKLLELTGSWTRKLLGCCGCCCISREETQDVHVFLDSGLKEVIDCRGFSSKVVTLFNYVTLFKYFLSAAKWVTLPENGRNSCILAQNPTLKLKVCTLITSWLFYFTFVVVMFKGKMMKTEDSAVHKHLSGPVNDPLQPSTQNNPHNRHLLFLGCLPLYSYSFSYYMTLLKHNNIYLYRRPSSFALLAKLTHRNERVSVRV